jgi:hypothetical protein
MPPYIFRESSGMVSPLLVVTSIVPIGLLIYLGINIYSAHNLQSKVLELCIFGLTALSILLIFSIRLRLEVNEHSIRVSYFPFKRFQFSREEIISINVLRVDPVSDFGGWGLRSNKSLGKAFTTKGEYVAQVVLKNSRKYCFTVIDTEAAKKCFQGLMADA